jgi:hypothetical protein
MKTIFLGDTHGRKIWKRIVEKEQDSDRIIFLGDYFDSREGISGPDQLQNFLEIVEFKKSSEKEVVLLFGNHDYHYMPGFSGIPYSGYQGGMAYDFREAISQNLDHLQMAYGFENILCSHAGISRKWLENLQLEGEIPEGVSEIADLVNQHFKFKPRVFEFNGIDPYGNDPWQTPIWIRPAALVSANSTDTEIVQIVGHTGVSDIFESVEMSKKSLKGKYFLIDAISDGGYLVFDGEEFHGSRVEI